MMPSVLARTSGVQRFSGIVSSTGVVKRCRLFSRAVRRAD
jgi:hypothetical protein